jgi:hypothetical protein
MTNRKTSKEAKVKKFKIHENIGNNNVEKDPTLELFRIGQDEKAGVIFTTKHQTIETHYCSEIEIASYIVCNEGPSGNDCILCDIGKRKVNMLLFPIYSYDSGKIEVLSVTNSLRPYALLPQIQNVLDANKMRVIFLSRDNNKYAISVNKLSKERRKIIGETIKLFTKSWESQEIDLSSVYKRFKNSTLAKCHEIYQKLELKGIVADKYEE